MKEQTKITTSEAIRILRRLSGSYGTKGARYHDDAAVDNAIRLNLLEYGPGGNCAHSSLYKKHANGKRQVDLECGEHVDPLDKQKEHQLSTSFPHGMFDCEEFDPK